MSSENQKKKIIINREIKRKTLRSMIRRDYIYKTITCIAAICVLWQMMFYPLDLIEKFSHFRFNFRVANFHASEKYLTVLDAFSLVTKHTSDFSYKVRNSVFKQYKKINREEEKDLYNPAGLFNIIHKDFEVLYTVNEAGNKDKKYKPKNYDKYLEYKKLYLEELKDILLTYKIKERTYDNFLTGRRREIAYQLPNRLELFSELAEAYLKYENLPLNKKTIKKLSLIMDSYDLIKQQEQTGGAVSMPPEGAYDGSFSSGFDSSAEDKFKQSYGKFIYDYSAVMEQLDSIMFVKDVCENSEAIGEYIKSLTLQNIDVKNEMETIIGMCRVEQNKAASQKNLNNAAPAENVLPQEEKKMTETEILLEKSRNEHAAAMAAKQQEEEQTGQKQPEVQPVSQIPMSVRIRQQGGQSSYGSPGYVQQQYQYQPPQYQYQPQPQYQYQPQPQPQPQYQYQPQQQYQYQPQYGGQPASSSQGYSVPQQDYSDGSYQESDVPSMN